MLPAAEQHTQVNVAKAQKESLLKMETVILPGAT